MAVHWLQFAGSLASRVPQYRVALVHSTTVSEDRPSGLITHVLSGYDESAYNMTGLGHGTSDLVTRSLTLGDPDCISAVGRRGYFPNTEWINEDSRATQSGQHL